jgi:hypothetical protein
MKVQVEKVKTLNEIKDYWTNEDYSKLLAEFDFPDAQNVKAENLEEMLFMAISDFETNEAASILLEYKLGDKLNEGQIDSLSHEMTVDKVAEEYPEPILHYDLFNINQLLFKAYNGKFPNTEATEVAFEVLDDDNIEIGTDKEILAKIFAGGVKESCLIKRLFSEQLEGKAEFKDAHKFIWRIENPEKNKYKLLTSKYWADKDDIAESFAVDVEMFDEE